MTKNIFLLIYPCRVYKGVSYEIFLIILSLIFSSIAFSNDHSHDHHHHHSDDSEMAMGPGGANEVINGIIKKIKPETSILIIDHEKIPSINMDAMVMPFKVADKKLFDGLEEEQKIGFKFRVEDNKFVIYQIYKNNFMHPDHKKHLPRINRVIGQLEGIKK